MTFGTLQNYPATSRVPSDPQSLRRMLHPRCVAVVGASNPVDLLASADANTYGQVLDVIGKSDEVDSVMIVVIPSIVTRAEDVANEIVRAREELPQERPGVTVFMGNAPRRTQIEHTER